MKLFSAVRYYLSPSYTTEQRELVQHLLRNNDAEEADSVGAATHVITNSQRFEGWQDLQPGTVVVTNKWLERSLLMGKLQPPLYYSADPAMIFSGVIACATDLPPQDLEVLSAGILALGGQWRTGLTKEVTHLFAVTSTSTKYATALHHQEQTNVKVVLPHWFDDSVRLGVGSLGTQPYEWPEPPLLKNSGPMDKTKKALAVEHDPMKRSLYSTVIKEGDVNPVWGGRKLLLSQTLMLSDGRREAVEVGIQRAGGQVVSADNEDTAAETCDIYITRWRHGRAYVRAFRSRKTIGTLAWLYHVQSTGTITRPLDQLLHYPIPKHTVEGFSLHEITVTNYTGEAREYLKKLITTMGAKFTPSMSGKNTALVAASKEGVKANKALAWSIPVVNHTWLEDCFVRWRNLTTATDKYLLFPEGLDFSTILGERGVGMGRLIEEEVEELEEELDAEKVNDIDMEEGGDARKVVEEGAMEVDGEVSPLGTAARANEEQELMDGDGDAIMLDQGWPRHDDDGDDGGSSMPSGKKSPKPKRVVESDAEEDEAVVEPVVKKGQPSPNRARQRRIQTYMEDDDEGEEVKKKKRLGTEEEEEDSANTSDESDTPSSKKKNLKTASPSKKSKSPAKPVAPAAKVKEKARKALSPSPPPANSDSGDEDDAIEVVRNIRPRLRPQVKRGVEVVNDEDQDGDGAVNLSLLRRRKGDATTRVKKVSKVAVPVEIEDDKNEEEQVGVKKGPSAVTKKAAGDVGDKGMAGKSTKAKAEKVNGKGKWKALKRESEEGGGGEEVVSPKKQAAVKSKSSSKSKPIPPPDDDDGESSDSSVPPEAIIVLSTSRSAHKKLSKAKKQTAKPAVSVLKPDFQLTTKNEKRKAASEDEDEDVEDEGAEEARKRRINRRRSLGTADIQVSASNKKQAAKSKSANITKSKTNTSSQVRRAASPSTSTTRAALPSTTSTATDTISQSPGKRLAATKATEKLHNVIMPDVLNFENQMRKSKSRSLKGGGGMAGFVVDGDMLVEEETKPARGVVAGKRRRAEVIIGGRSGGEVDGDEGGEKGRKRVKGNHVNGQSSSSRSNKLNGEDSTSERGTLVRLATTQGALPEDVIKTLTKLGVAMTSKASECTHLLASGVVRTEKFLCAIAIGAHILKREWALDSAKANKLLPENTYVLRDADNKYDLDLEESLGRARKGKLLQGKVFYVAGKTVSNSVGLLKNVVTACGGQIKEVQKLTQRLIGAGPDRYAISSQEDVSVWRQLAEQGSTVYSVELVLSGALHQWLDLDSYHLQASSSC